MKNLSIMPFTIAIILSFTSCTPRYYRNVDTQKRAAAAEWVKDYCEKTGAKRLNKYAYCDPVTGEIREVDHTKFSSIKYALTHLDNPSGKRKIRRPKTDMYSIYKQNLKKYREHKRQAHIAHRLWTTWERQEARLGRPVARYATNAELKRIERQHAQYKRLFSRRQRYTKPSPALEAERRAWRERERFEDSAQNGGKGSGWWIYNERLRRYVRTNYSTYKSYNGYKVSY